MADDYDYDADGVLDFDDGWLYVEDEFDLAVCLTPFCVSAACVFPSRTRAIGLAMFRCGLMHDVTLEKTNC